MEELLKALGSGIITPEIKEQLEKFLEENPIDPKYDEHYNMLDGPMVPFEQDFARWAKYILENTEEFLKDFE